MLKTHVRQYSRQSPDAPTDGMADSVRVQNSVSAVKYKLHAQFLRILSPHDDVNDADRAGANRLQNNALKISLQKAWLSDCLTLRSTRFLC